MDSQTYTILLAVAITFTAAVLFVSIFVLIKLNALYKNRDTDQSMALLNQSMQALQSNFQEGMDRTNQAINNRLDNAAKVIGAVSKELGQMSQIGQSLQNFQDLLKNPKMRGGLGEQGLKDMLSQTFPNELYNMQYKFRNGQIVDAAIKIEAGIVPVDAKFPLENFNRILKAKTE